MREPSQEEIKESLRYDEDTGKFYWSAKRPGLRIGDEAGSMSDQGYIVIRLNGKLYRAHRLAWVYVHGNITDDEIDHINGTRDDNTIINLRLVTRQENRKNQGKIVSNTSGHNGVMWYKAGMKWHASINSAGNKYHLGYFDRIEDAIAARAAAEEAFKFHENHGERNSWVRENKLAEANKLVIQ